MSYERGFLMHRQFFVLVLQLRKLNMRFLSTSIQFTPLPLHSPFLNTQYLILLLLLASCTSSPNENILARIGDEIITPEEFVMNYEFGHGHLRAGENPKKEYLQYLVYESLMAQEAAKQNLDTLQTIQHAMHTLQEELLIERVFEEKALAGIEVTDEEIRDEMNKDAVSFQFRLLPVGTEQDGRRLRRAMLETSFEEVMEDQLEKVPELRQVEGELTSPFVKAEDLDPAVMEILKDLSLNEPSEPRLYQGAWYIFEVVNIRRQRLSEDDYKNKTPTYQKIIHNRKAMERGTAFVAETMQPLNVSTKRAGLEILSASLFDWYTEKTPERNLIHYIEAQRLKTPYTEALVENYEIPLVQFGNTSWSIRDFLEHFTPARYVIRPDVERSFKARLADIVALVVRDFVLLDVAEKEDLHDDDNYRRTTELWKSKWLFQEYRNLLIADKPAQEVRALVEAHAESLFARSDVYINWAMLDTLQASVSTINPTMTVHLFKNNANKMPFPIADPNWRPAD